MPDESYPLEISGDTYYLRFEDKDVQEIERTVSLFVAFHPQYRTFENAAVILWRGLRKTTDAGDLVYAIQQGPPGKTIALSLLKQFMQQFRGPAGMVVLYGYIEKALILSGWFGDPDTESSSSPAKGDEEKN